MNRGYIGQGAWQKSRMNAAFESAEAVHAGARLQLAAPQAEGPVQCYGYLFEAWSVCPKAVGKFAGYALAKSGPDIAIAGKLKRWVKKSAKYVLSSSVRLELAYRAVATKKRLQQQFGSPFMTKSRCAVTGILLIGSCLAGCSKPEQQAPLAAFADDQRESLNYVFYRDNPSPEPPTEEELKAARQTITAAEEFERQVLTELYPDDPELRALAIRDSDGDGVFDFRISDYYGRFMEGDTDLDGDGTDNVLDSNPYIPGTHIASGPIPAHVDWAKQGKPAAMVRIQRELFVNNQILLVERSAEFSLRLAQSVNDTIQRVYREIFADGGTLRTLRIIATERASLLNADDEQGAQDYAQVLPASQTIEIYRRGIDAAPAIQLGFLTHEIGHSIQFALDYDQQRRGEIAQRNYFAAHNFYESIEIFGWTLEHLEQDPDAEFELFRPQYISQEPYQYRYLEETPASWALWLGEIYDEVGPEDYLSDQRLVERHIVGDYSLSGPWEWHSDHLIAYIYLAMLEAAEAICSRDERRELANRFQKETIEKEWPYFRFENARGAPIQKQLANEYPLDSDDIAYLSETYLLANYPGYCLVEPAPDAIDGSARPFFRLDDIASARSLVSPVVGSKKLAALVVAAGGHKI